MAADGSEVIFTSTSELTDDAYTGRTSGVPNNKGSDLYSYDVETGDLTDLTVDHEPADKETGAGVEHVVGASRDASYIYFIASGKLAPGETSGAAQPLRRARRRDQVRRHQPGRHLRNRLSLLRHSRTASTPPS